MEVAEGRYHGPVHAKQRGYRIYYLRDSMGWRRGVPDE
jgi:hypothetical protein